MAQPQHDHASYNNPNSGNYNNNISNRVGGMGVASVIHYSWHTGCSWWQPHTD